MPTPFSTARVSLSLLPKHAIAILSYYAMAGAPLTDLAKSFDLRHTAIAEPSGVPSEKPVPSSCSCSCRSTRLTSVPSSRSSRSSSLLRKAQPQRPRSHGPAAVAMKLSPSPRRKNPRSPCASSCCPVPASSFACAGGSGNISSKSGTRILFSIDPGLLPTLLPRSFCRFLLIPRHKPR